MPYLGVAYASAQSLFDHVPSVLAVDSVPIQLIPSFASSVKPASVVLPAVIQSVPSVAVSVKSPLVDVPAVV